VAAERASTTLEAEAIG